MHHISSLLLLPLLSFIVSVCAWDYTQQFQQELLNEGLTELANVVSTINQTSIGQALLSQISQDNYTFFAPTDEAIQNISSISSQLPGNTTLLAEYLSYHFVHGNFQNVSSCNQPSSTTTTTSGSSSSTATAGATASLFERLFGHQSVWLDSSSSPQLDSGIYPNTTLGRTLLNASELVMLPGNKSQVLAWTRSDENGNVTILNQIQNITVINTTQWLNLFINRVNGVFIPPGNVSTALNATNATITFNLLSSIQFPSSNGTNETALEFLQEATGITLFVPNNTAFTSEVNQTVASLQNNITAITALIQNHYINGTVLYSPLIQVLGENSTSANATSAAGEPLHFITNSTGTFVEGSSGSGAQIIRPDVLIDNGVIHIINGILFNNESDPSAASSAYASATSAAASSTTENGPIGVTTSGASTASETSSSPSSSESSSSPSSSESSSSPSSSESSSSPSSSSESSSQPSSSQPSATNTSGAGGTVTVTASA